MFWFIVFLLLVGAAFYLYQNLRTMEKEIREEQLREQEQMNKQQGPEPQTEVVESVEETSAVDVMSDEGSLNVEANSDVEDNELVRLIKENPGIKQTDLYGNVQSYSNKQVQQILKKMADNGEIRREKDGSSYRLYL